MRSEFLNTLHRRGYVHQVTSLEGLDAAAAAGGIAGYIGFDLTAKSLHVGNLVSIMLLRRLQQAGHTPIILLGGGTSMVGDPSGKDEGRQLMTPETIAANKASIEKVFARFLDMGNAIVVDNAEWLGELQYIPFLREVGRHFSVNRMLGFDSVRLRLEREQPLSFLEFNYMILQAYDFLELSRRYGCVLQMGGSDQWGNIVNGMELVRRMDGREVFGLTTPLVTTAGGAKMGKTASGAVWLNPDMLSPYEYWQFWRNIADADLPTSLRLFTELDEAEIDRLSALEGAEINDAKKLLADLATTLAHGREAADAARATAEATFEAGGAGSALPTFAVADGAIPLLDALVALGLAASRNEARRLVAQGGARVDGEAVTDPDAKLIVPPAGLRLSAGRKRHGLLVPAITPR